MPRTGDPIPMASANDLKQGIEATARRMVFHEPGKTRYGALSGWPATSGHRVRAVEFAAGMIRADMLAILSEREVAPSARKLVRLKRNEAVC